MGAVLVAAVALGHDEQAETAAAEPRPPVVLVIFDEFPADTLLRPDGQIDAARFPNFAALARTSTWFRNGHTIYDSTFKAVPAILDARMPRPRTAPDVRSHQPSVYHLMDSLGYQIVKVESGTAVCPQWICIGTRTRRPGVLSRLAGGGRPERLHKWIGAIRHRTRQTFYLHHALLPHEPWIYLPSGHQSRPAGEDPIKGMNHPEGFHNAGLTDHNHLRHLLQVGYTDRQLGLIMQRLRRTGLFQRSLLIVVADHGYAFDLNVPSRRQVTERNFEQIAAVPFFVKAPGQTDGVVDDSLVRNIDVVPTIADLLEAEIWWRHDGQSVFSAEARARDTLSMPRRDFSRVVSISGDDFERRREELRSWRASKFGTGAISELMFGDPWASAYRIGPHPEVLGQRVTGIGTARVKLANEALLEDVDPAAEILPTRVTGRLRGSPPGTTRDLAVAVNGRVQAVGHSFRLRGRRPEFFSMMVPESALRPGHNEVQVLEVGAGGRLQPL
jgi:hypothetical protein